MNFYMDDDSTEKDLVRLLRSAGHNVVIPSDVGLNGKEDAVHLDRAITEDRILVTRNYDHFLQLHNLVIHSGGSHPGIFVERQDKEPKKNLRPHEIVRAIGNLLRAAIPIRSLYTVL